MIKLETHCHTKGGSPCGIADFRDVVDRYLSEGYGGVVVTNHCNRTYYNDYPGETHKEKTDFYFSLYENVKLEGEKRGLKVFFGIEVRDCLGTEYMLYGFERSFLYDNKPLFTFDQKELFELAEKNKLFMYQTHPTREGVTLGNPRYMHGAEAFNGHYHHKNNNEQAKKFVIENSLVSMSGTDFHRDNQPITAGIIIPDSIQNERELADCIFQGKYSMITEQEKYQKYFLAYSEGRIL